VTTQLAGCPPVPLHSFTRLRHSRHGVSQPATVPAAGEGTGRGPLHPATASADQPHREAGGR